LNKNIKKKDDKFTYVKEVTDINLRMLYMHKM